MINMENILSIFSRKGWNLIFPPNGLIFITPEEEFDKIIYEFEDWKTFVDFLKENFMEDDTHQTTEEVMSKTMALAKEQLSQYKKENGQ